LRDGQRTRRNGLRRARLANDTPEVERLTAVTEGLRQQLMALRVAQDERIVALLRPEQRPLFDDYVAERRQTVGSSRDERLFD
jgi:Spy/CpxP family protein refolding chaperone